MVIDFSKIQLKDTPKLVLRNLDNTAIQVLGCAYGLQLELCYNEVSTLTFSLPKYVDGVKTPGYEKVVGTRIVDLIGWGQFYLVDPERENDGLKEIKTCKAFSLEYEFSKKKMSLEESTYNFWNPTAPDETVLGIILEYMPSWSVGEVDEKLIGKYRTFSVSNANVYDFIKSTVQKSYSCIFEFDTYARKINVKHTESDAETSAVFISLDNLAKKITVKEETDDLVTVLDVNGADGVDIRSVNPTGTNRIYNLDYYMNTDHFSREMIEKWENWKQTFDESQPEYYRLAIKRMLLLSESLAKENQINELRNVNIASLRNVRDAKLELLTSNGHSELYVAVSDTEPSASGVVNEPTTEEYRRQLLTHIKVEDDQNQTTTNDDFIEYNRCVTNWFSGGTANYWAIFDAIENGNCIISGRLTHPQSTDAGHTVRLQKGDIEFDLVSVQDAPTKTSIETMAQIQDLNEQIRELESQIEEIEDDLRMNTDQELLYVTQQMKDINQECSFASYFTDEELLILDRYFIDDSLNEASFVLSTANAYINEDHSFPLQGAEITFSGSDITLYNESGQSKLYDIRGGSVIVQEPVSGVEPAAMFQINKATVEIRQDGKFVLAAHTGVGAINGESLSGGHLSITASYGSEIDSDLVIDSETPSSLYNGSRVVFSSSGMQLYFTQNPTEYEQYSVEWDLFEYGMDCLNKLAYPTYSFTVDSANFFALDEFRSFVLQTALGKRVYLELEEGVVMDPILTGVSLNLEDLASLSLKFGSSYSMYDNAFHLVDLLQQSVSLGRTLDTSRFGYNSFIDSGASTAVKEFMDGALDASKNAISSGDGFNLVFDGSGLHGRKIASDGTVSPEEIAIINNSIVFTDNNWDTAKMAIGHFSDPNLGESWGIVAPSIVGTLLAGRNLVIESEKQDGGVSVFRVDGNGALLHNARFDIEDSHKHIILDPVLGFAIGEYPVVKDGAIDIGTSSAPGNAKFWVDTDGNVYMRGTLEGCDGTFSGALSGGTISIGNGNFAVDANGNMTANTGTFKGTVYGADYKDENGSSMVNSDGQFLPDYLDLKGLTIRDENNNVTFQVDSNGNVTMKGSLDGCDGTFNGSVVWRNNDSTASISFTQGAAGQTVTDLIALKTNKGILLDADGNTSDGLTGNIRIKASSRVWFEADPESIMLCVGKGTSSAHYVSLTDYIRSLISGS